MPLPGDVSVTIDDGAGAGEADGGTGKGFLGIAGSDELGRLSKREPPGELDGESVLSNMSSGTDGEAPRGGEIASSRRRIELLPAAP